MDMKTAPPPHLTHLVNHGDHFEDLEDVIKNMRVMAKASDIVTETNHRSVPEALLSSNDIKPSPPPSSPSPPPQPLDAAAFLLPPSSLHRRFIATCERRRAWKRRRLKPPTFRNSRSDIAFDLSQQEMVLAVQYGASEMANGSYLVHHFKKVDGERLVIWIPVGEQIHCPCKEFETTGIWALKEMKEIGNDSLSSISKKETEPINQTKPQPLWLDPDFFLKSSSTETETEPINQSKPQPLWLDPDFFLKSSSTETAADSLIWLFKKRLNLRDVNLSLGELVLEECSQAMKDVLARRVRERRSRYVRVLAEVPYVGLYDLRLMNYARGNHVLVHEWGLIVAGNELKIGDFVEGWGIVVGNDGGGEIYFICELYIRRQDSSSSSRDHKRGDHGDKRKDNPAGERR